MIGLICRNNTFSIQRKNNKVSVWWLKWDYSAGKSPMLRGSGSALLFRQCLMLALTFWEECKALSLSISLCVCPRSLCLTEFLTFLACWDHVPWEHLKTPQEKEQGCAGWVFTTETPSPCWNFLKNRSIRQRFWKRIKSIQFKHRVHLINACNTLLKSFNVHIISTVSFQK